MTRGQLFEALGLQRAALVAGPVFSPAPSTTTCLAPRSIACLTSRSIQCVRQRTDSIRPAAPRPPGRSSRNRRSWWGGASSGSWGKHQAVAAPCAAACRPAAHWRARVRTGRGHTPGYLSEISCSSRAPSEGTSSPMSATSMRGQVGNMRSAYSSTNSREAAGSRLNLGSGPSFKRPGRASTAAANQSHPTEAELCFRFLFVLL